jgi:hypothetical protein
VGVVSNEPVRGRGDDHTAPDWLVKSATSVLLRAERAEHGSGRVYTITVTCRDGSGNRSVQGTTVKVPKSMGKHGRQEPEDRREKDEDRNRKSEGRR